MNKLNYFLKAVLCLAMTAGMLCACKKDSVDSGKKDTPQEYLEAEKDTVYFMSAAATDRILSVNASDNSWIAELDSDEWCGIKTAKNSLGEKELKISVQENTDTVERKCHITLTLGEISVKVAVVQMGAVIDDAYKIVVEKEEYQLAYPSTELVIPVIADGEFEVVSSAEWLAFKSKETAEDGQTLVTLDVERNGDEQSRTAEIKFTSLRTSALVSVTQQGYTPLQISQEAFKASFLEDTVTVEIISLDDFTISIEEGKKWLTLVEDETQGSVAKFAVEANPYKIDRTAVVTVKSAGNTATFTITQIALKEYPTMSDDKQPEDVIVPIVSATVSSFVSATRNAEKLYDGDFNTFWSTEVDTKTDYAQIEAQFDAQTPNAIDYMAITHTSRVSWGQFGEIEVYATDREGSETLVGSMNCGMINNGTSKMEFKPALTDVAKMRIKILSSKNSSSSGNSVPACAAEIQFFANNPDKFDPLSIFTDKSCTALKEGITLQDIEKIQSDFYKNIAEQIYMGIYNRFRTCVAKPYPHPDRDADIHLTKPMGTLLDNVTGMYFAKANQEHIILVGDTHGQKIQMRVVDWVNNGGYGSMHTSPSDYTLTEGRNKIKVGYSGMIYILYHTDDYASAEPININFPTASVNGYFDITKHSLDDFKEIFESATAAEQRNFDMVTDDCLLCFPKEAYKSSTLLGSFKDVSRVKEMLMIFDTVFKIEEELQGLKKYQALGLQREWRNKGPFYGDYAGGYGYSGWYVTGYGVGSMALDLLNPTRMWNKTATKYNNNIVGSVWGLAHELGHSTQTINFEWRGLSEVTNNLNCAVVQDRFFGLGNTTMWFNDHFNRGMRDIAVRIVTDIDGKQHRMTHCESVNTPSAGNVDGGVDPTTQLMPFWQLYLYYHHVVGNTDFYPDFYEICRLGGNWDRTDENNRKSMLEYIKRVSDAAKEDLSDFCDAWGLPGINTGIGVNKGVKVNHYGQNFVTTTQADLDEMYAYCSKYPKPKLNPLYINDMNVDMYRHPVAVTAGTHTYGENGRYTMSGWSGVVAWELVDPETGRTICIHTNDNTFTFAEYPSIYIADSNGSDYVYSNSNNTNRALKAVSPVYYPNALVYGVAADGSKTASLSNTK